MEYAEFLRSQGATEDEIKALTEGSFASAAKRAFSQMESRIAAEAAARAAAETKARESDAAVATMEQWYKEKQVPEFTAMQNRTIVAEAERAKAIAALRTAQERGLLNVAKDLGYDVDAPVRPAAPATPSEPDKRYLTVEAAVELAEREGHAIAIAQDIAAEHARLFPDKPLNFRELRAEAVKRKVPFEQLWMDRYQVQAARDARAKADREADVARWKAEGAKEAETRFVSQYGNPDTRPLSPSSDPFAKRPAVGREKQPWELNENELRKDRITRATQHFVESTTRQTH